MEWQIIQGDCLDVMRTMPDGSFDMVFTSPPYNLANGAGGGFRSPTGSNWRGNTLRDGYANHDDNMPHEKYVAWQHEVLRECWRLLDETGAIYYNHKPLHRQGVLRLPLELNPGLPLRDLIIWDRISSNNFNRQFYAPQCEWIMVLAKPAFELRDQGASGVGNLWRVPPEPCDWHPAPFPSALPRMALQTTGARRVLDPFCGSGRTGLACLVEGREFVGIDNSLEYVIGARQELEWLSKRAKQWRMAI